MKKQLETKRKRDEADKRAQENLASFFGESGVNCSSCHQNKLHSEFMQTSFAACSHLQQMCLRCLKEKLSQKMVCPDQGCKKRIAGDEKAALETR